MWICGWLGTLSLSFLYWFPDLTLTSSKLILVLGGKKKGRYNIDIYHFYFSGDKRCLCGFNQRRGEKGIKLHSLYVASLTQFPSLTHPLKGTGQLDQGSPTSCLIPYFACCLTPENVEPWAVGWQHFSHVHKSASTWGWFNSQAAIHTVLESRSWEGTAIGRENGPKSASAPLPRLSIEREKSKVPIASHRSPLPSQPTMHFFQGGSNSHLHLMGQLIILVLLGVQTTSFHVFK